MPQRLYINSRFRSPAIVSRAIVYLIPLLLSSKIAYTQKSFSLKTIRPYIMPIYSFNKSGLKEEPVYDNCDSAGISLYKKTSADKANTSPGITSVKNNFNFSAGVDYEFWLPEKLFAGVGAEFRTLNNTVYYDYDFNKFLSDRTSFFAPEPERFAYHQRLNLLSFSLHLGKSFFIRENVLEARVGVSIPFNLNTISSFEHLNHYLLISQNGNGYMLPYTYQQANNLNRYYGFTPDALRWHLYIGSSRSIPVSSKMVRISYGLQLNYVRRSDNSLMLQSLYDFAIDGAKAFYKSQRTEFSDSGVPELALKIGLAL